MDSKLLNTTSCARDSGRGDTIGNQPLQHLPVAYDGSDSALQNNQALMYQTHQLPKNDTVDYFAHSKENEYPNEHDQETLYRLQQALYHESYLRQHKSRGNRTLLTPKTQEPSGNTGYPYSQARTRVYAHGGKPYASSTRRTRQISNTDLDGSSDKENHYGYTSSTKVIPIVTPVPLLYTARSKDVLRSMISSSGGTNDVGPSGVTGIEAISEFPNSQPPEANPLRQNDTSHGLADRNPPLLAKADSDVVPVHVSETPATQGLRTIEPITPSTLMALTEPFLMSWCADIDWTPPELARTLLPYEDATHTPSAQLSYTHNNWGY